MSKNTTIRHKRSSVPGNVPDSDQIDVGELAINFPDQTLYTKDGEGQIIELGSVHDSAQVQGQIDSNATSYLKKNAYNYNSTGEIAYTQYGGTLGGDSDYRKAKIGSVYGFGIDEGASVIYGETPGGKFMVNDLGVMLEQADLIVRTPNNPTAKKGSASGFWKISGMSLIGDSATIGTVSFDSATVSKIETSTLTSPSGTNLNLEYGGSTRLRIKSNEMELFETANYNSAVSAFVEASGGANALIHKGYVDDNMLDSANVVGIIDSNASNYLQTTAYGFDNTVDSATINKLTVGPDSADDSKLYFETGGGTHVLEGREEGAIDMGAWTHIDPPGGRLNWSGVVYGGGTWVAVSKGASGLASDQVIYSTNGTDWIETTAAAQETWKRVTWTGNEFVAVSHSAKVMTSTDGITWSSSNLYNTPSANWQDIAHGNSTLVIVGVSRAIAYSTDAGQTWTTASPPTGHTSGHYWGVEYADGKFVVVGDYGKVATSTDGQTWTAQTPSTVADWRDVAYGNDMWVAVSRDAADRVMYSSDAVTWTDVPQYSVLENRWNSITFGDGKFVAMSTNGSQRLMHSVDGISWIVRTISTSVEWMDVAYGGNRFVATGMGSNSQIVTLEHDADKAGLFYDGELVATTENLRPLLDKLTEISNYDFNAADLNFADLQDSAGGLATGKLYRDSDTIRVVL